MVEAEGKLQRFHWTGQGNIPALVDLRLCGWRLQPLPVGEALPDVLDCPMLVERASLEPYRWRALVGPEQAAARRWMLVVGIANAAERAWLLGKGFGEAIAPDIALAEVQARAWRVAQQAQYLPRRRELAGLSLDLLAREAFYQQRALGLHPREFLLLWRLMEADGRPVDKRELLRDVWQLSYVPETNSVAVHVSRLRSKLAMAGLGGWLRSVALGGGYCLVPVVGHDVAMINAADG